MANTSVVLDRVLNYEIVKRKYSRTCTLYVNNVINVMRV